jgi:hypothetical protein
VANFPSSLFIREPIVAGESNLDQSLLIDLNAAFREIEAIETILGAGPGPKGSFASLAARLDAQFSPSGRLRRKVCSYYNWETDVFFNTDQSGIKGQVQNYIQCGEVAVADPAVQSRTITFTRSYTTNLPNQIILKARNNTNTLPIVLQVLAGTLTSNTVQCYALSTLADGAPVTVGAPNGSYFIQWLALGGHA